MYAEAIGSTCHDDIMFTGPEYVDLYHRPRAASPCGGNLLCTSWTTEIRDHSRALCVLQTVDSIGITLLIYRSSCFADLVAVTRLA